MHLVDLLLASPPPVILHTVHIISDYFRCKHVLVILLGLQLFTFLINLVHGKTCDTATKSTRIHPIMIKQ